MSAKAFETIRSACIAARDRGLRLHRGPWFNLNADTIVGCCAIGAVLLDLPRPADLSNPGFVKAACDRLDVDAFFLQRFWMGWDRGHVVTLVREKDGKSSESKDEISGAALALAREFRV